MIVAESVLRALPLLIDFFGIEISSASRFGFRDQRGLLAHLPPYPTKVSVTPGTPQNRRNYALEVIAPDGEISTSIGRKLSPALLIMSSCSAAELL